MSATGPVAVGIEIDRKLADLLTALELPVLRQLERMPGINLRRANGRECTTC
jgi:hypothetical protein